MAEVKTVYKGDSVFEAHIGEQRIVMDSNPPNDGAPRGILPPQVFIASLGGCIAAYAAKYCETANLNAAGMTVTLSFEKASDPPRLSSLVAAIDLPNADVGKRMKALEKAVSHCPVHETIKTMDGFSLLIKARDGSLESHVSG